MSAHLIRRARTLALSLLPLLLAFAGLLAAAPARAATLTVTTLNDSGAGSLRQALLSAASGDTITFQSGLSGTITLTSGALPTITQNLALTGPGAGVLAVDGGHTASAAGSRVFVVSAGTVNFSGLTVQNGQAPADGAPFNGGGGGVAISGGTVTLTGCTLTGNQGANVKGGYYGGGVYNNGTVMLTGCLLEKNAAVGANGGGSFGGGGLLNKGTATLTDCAFIDNSAISIDSDYSGVGQGGGVYNKGALTLTGCSFSGNSAGDGGGVYSSNQASLTDCTLTNNTASGTDGGAGGGVYNYTGTVTLTGCAFSANGATYSGGGVSSDSGTASLTGCSFSGNSAAYGGGVSGSGYYGGGTVTLTGCAFTGNSGYYGGGFANVNHASLTDCSFSGNSVSANSGGENYGTGGGVYNGSVYDYSNDTEIPAPLTLTGCSFSGNSTTYYGSGLYNSGTATLTDDVLYADIGNEEIDNDTGDGGSLTATHCDVQGGYAGTANLNAPPLFTSPATGDLHLKPGSPCVGAGTPVTGLTVDKDGTPRPNPPSIGAYELGSTLTVPAQYATIQAAINAAHTDNTVLIGDGTYTGPGNVDLDFGGKNITVTSANGPTKTLLNCAGSSSANHRGFYFHSGETAAVVSGLTVENGYVGRNGGGIWIASGGVTVQNCLLKNDTAANLGGGIACGGGAGALAVALESCTFTGNAAVLGAGAYNDTTVGGGTVALTGCTLEGNVSSGDGGGVAIEGYPISLTNCVLLGNTSGGNGGGVFVNGGGVGTNGVNAVTNCTITGNTAHGSGGGAGVYSAPSFATTLALTNDIVYGDTGNGEIVGSNVAATNCDVQGGYVGPNDINADPLFYNPPADLHLQPNSPCLGAGTTVGAPTTALDGRMRPSPPSIGAYETVLFSTSTTVSSSLNPSNLGQIVTFKITVHSSGGTPTGSAALVIDGSEVASVTLSGGSGSYTTSSLSGGSHAIKASYGGDGPFTASYTPTALTQTVIPPATTTSLTSSLNPSAAGQSVSFQARVSGSGATPTGTVTFLDGTTTLGTATLSSGTATFTTSSLAADSHRITASYGGDGNNAASTSGALTQAVSTTTPTAVSVAYVSTAYCQTVTLSATLTGGGSGLSGKSVTFSVDGVSLGPSTTNASGVATNTYYYAGGLGVGSHTITASFAGDASYAASSGTGTLTVTKANATVAVASVTGTRGQTVTLSATLSRAGDGAKMANRTLTFKVDSTVVGTAVTNSSGVATKSYAIPVSLSLGSHTVTVTFPAEANYNASSGTGTLTVGQATALSVASASTVCYQTVALTATLTSGGAGVSGKSVTFSVDGISLGPYTTNANGVATDTYYSAGGLGAGSHTISCAFAGDGSYVASSGTGTLTVTKANATVAVANASGARGATVTLSATLSRSYDGALMGSRTLTFLVDGASLGTAVTNSSGTATKSYAIPAGSAVGSHTVTVSFPAEANYNASSGTGTLTVN